MADGVQELDREEDIDAEDEMKTPMDGFMQSQLQMQARASREADNVDKEKRENFIERATAASRRMNKEIEKSREKSAMLRSEFGEQMMTKWREEHAAEVLTAKQAALVEQTYQNQ